jgi:hypothetical protein
MRILWRVLGLRLWTMIFGTFSGQIVVHFRRIFGLTPGAILSLSDGYCRVFFLKMPNIIFSVMQKPFIKCVIHQRIGRFLHSRKKLIRRFQKTAGQHTTRYRGQNSRLKIKKLLAAPPWIFIKSFPLFVRYSWSLLFWREIWIPPSCTPPSFECFFDCFI